jgi:integrase/recombinase XerD
MIQQTSQLLRWAMPGRAQAAKLDENQNLVTQYLEWKKSYASKAAQKYAVWVRRFQAFINKAPEAITVGDWTAFARSLDGRFVPKTIEFALCVIHNYLRFWNEQGRLRSLPLYLARVPKAIARSHNAITEDEYVRIVEHLRTKGDQGLRDLTIIMLLHDTGMRVGELVRIEIDQIEEDCSAVIETEKTVRRRRVFWNPETDEAVQRLIVERVNSGAKADWLFVGQGRGGETPLSSKSVQRMMRSVLKAVGIGRRLSPHSFRHAYIHRLARRGVPDAVIAQLVGHTTPHTVAHYTKLSRREFEEAARGKLREVATNA